MALWRRLLPVLLLLAATTAAARLAGAGAQAAADDADDEYTPYPSPYCSQQDNFTAGSTYQFNVYRLGELLRQGATENGGFYNTSYGIGRDEVFGLLMCYVDHSWDMCERCLNASVAWVGAGCPYSRSASVNYDRCLIRYSNQPFFGAADQLDLPAWIVRSLDYTMDAVDAARLNETRWTLIGQLAEQAASSRLRFAYNSSSYTDSKSNGSMQVYALAQCRQDLVHDECTSCLDNMRTDLVNYVPNDTFASYLGYSCYLRYSLMDPLEIIAPPAPPGNSDYKRKGVSKLIMLVAGLSITGIVGFLACLGLARRYHLQWRKGRAAAKEKSTGAPAYFRGEAVEVVELEQGTGTRRFSHKELAAATANFSADRKLGEGGFGSVYRGFLEDLNLDVAIKRVSKSSQQGWNEFMSEVRIISRLRHRNLVLLIGWCYGDGDDLLLVYELMHNGSVDSHLYNPFKTLAWRVRYQIVLGIGSALLYLHQETEPCVVHRDVKPSNVMLDASFAAKLGDFGLARVIEDGRRSRTTAAAGTTGYVDPECLATGRTSVESDVYSFGVLLLEIACGRCPVVTLPNGSTVHLVQRVWELHEAGRAFEATDARLDGDYNVQEMERVLAVGLWCAHPDRIQRPHIRHALNVLRFDAPLPILPAKLPAVSAQLQPLADALFDAATSSCSAPVIREASSNCRGIELV